MNARVISQPAPKLYYFTDLKPGDFLVATETGSIGVKTSAGGIFWVARGPRSDNHGPLGNFTRPEDIGYKKQYAIPSDVVITL